MRRSSRGFRILAILLGLSLIGAACGGDDDDEATDTTASEDEEAEIREGGEFVDLGTFVGDPPENIDPALNVTLDGFQVTNALYDGLTEMDFSDPDNPELKGLVAESWEGNDEATVWTFTIKDGLEFSDGDPVLPSSFVRAWERATDPDFAGDYSYLFNFIQGGEEKLDGEAETIAGVEADDEAMTLEVTLSAPYANFPTVAGFQLFYPMPSAIDELDDQNAWENGLMIGNGPFKLEKPRTDQEIVLVPNERWAGDIHGVTADDVHLDRIIFRVSADPDSSYNSFEAGEGHNGNVPPGRWGEAQENHKNVIRPALGSRHYEIKWDHPVVGGEENVKLRQAINTAINREEVSEAIYQGTNPPSTGIAPPGIPGREDGLCEYCDYDTERAEELFQEWQDEGNELTEPIKIQLNADAGHEEVVAIFVDNLAEVGIEAVAEPFPSETYFTQLTDGACVICRSGWYADYPTYDNFMYDLFHSDAIGGNNHGFYSNPEFDELIDEAKATTDEDEAAELYRQAEDILVNQDTAVLPLLYYAHDYVYGDDVARFPVDALGLIQWQGVALAAE